MAIQIDDIEPRRSYDVGGTPQAEFTIPFPFFDAADIRASVAGVELESGFTVTGAGSSSGGTLTLAAPVSNTVVMVWRDVAIKRISQFPVSGPFKIDVLNTDLNKQVAVSQQLADRLGRSIRIPDAERTAATEIPSAAVRARKSLIFDDDGNVAVSSFDFEEQAQFPVQAAASAAQAAAAKTGAEQARDQAAIIRDQTSAVALGDFLQAGTGAVLRPVPNKLRDVFSVGDFGATGNGTTDDRAAILSAVTAGALVSKTVRVPAGTYRVTGELSLPSGTILAGDGPGKTNIRFDSAASGRLMTLNGVNGVQVRDMTLDGNKAVATSDFSVFVYGATNCLFSNVEFLNLAGTNSGCLLIGGGSKGNVVEGCRFLDAEATAIGITEPTTAFNTVRNCEIQRSGAFGIRLGESTHKNKVEGCWTDENGIELIGIANSAYENQILGNRAQGCGDNGISVSGSRNTVAGNVCKLNYRAGIYMWGGYNTVTGNECINNNVEGINPWPGIGSSAAYGGTGQHNVVSGNIVDDDRAVPLQHGIRVDGNGYTLWASGATIAAGSYRYYGLNVYYTGTGGTAGVTAPTHTSGTASDGGVSWEYRSTFDTNVTYGYATVVGNDVRRYAGGGPYAAQYGWAAYQNILLARGASHLVDVNLTGALRIGATAGAGYTSVQNIYATGLGNVGILLEPGVSSLGRVAFGDGSAYAAGLEYSRSDGRLKLMMGSQEWLSVRANGEISHRQNNSMIVDANSHLTLRSYTVSTLPSPTGARMIYVSDGASAKHLAVSDGTNWRWPDGSVVS